VFHHLVASGNGILALAGDLSQYLRPNPSFHERGAGQPSQTDVPTLALHDGAQDPTLPSCGVDAEKKTVPIGVEAVNAHGREKSFDGARLGFGPAFQL
jgi:hypothetical protein